MQHTQWIVVVGGMAAFLNAVTVGEPGSLSASTHPPAYTLFIGPRTCTTECRRCRDIAAGANNVALCWGPALGAKALKYRTAVLLGGLSQLAGVLAFGPRTYTIYGGFLSADFDFNAQPELMLYAVMWTVITPVVWQLLAIRWQKLVPTYLGTGKA